MTTTPIPLRTQQVIDAYPVRIGFTGTREVNTTVLDAIQRYVIGMQAEGVVAVTGGCVGVDAFVARAVIARGLPLHVILPIDRSRVDPGWRSYCTSYYEMPAGSSYRDRNAEIVRCSTSLVAIPAAAEAAPVSRRSGTWMTVRLARTAALPIFVIRCFR